MDDKQARSVFVGNIPHGTTEEQMKDIFAVVGSVLSFRIVYDRETGNPKGYGFAEYQDVETAQSAIRNLNGFEFGGRTLRVDKASSQADELRMVQQQNQLTSGPTVVENFYGPPVDPRRAPEVISQAVASLPPEQMFELMKQLKTCIQNNPSQARQMLLHNPQLAYALLQAQVVMRIVEPQVAIALLYRQDPSLVTPLQPIVAPNAPASMPFSHPPIPPVVNNPLLGHVVGPMPPVSLPFPSPPMPPPNHSHPSLMFPGPMPSSQQPNVAPGQQQQSLPAIDQERANLIMQVIQLSDNQIAMLPPEQRHNILMLKEQIVNNGTPPSNVTMQQANQQ